MRILAVIPDRSSRVIAVGVVLLVLASVCIILKSKPQVRAVRTASGAVIRLESYAFRPGRVRYYSAQRPLVRLIAKVLPDAAVSKIKWLRPEVTSVVTAPFANEPLLSAAFSSRDASRRVGTPGTRVVVLDEHGQSFDEEVNYMGAYGVFEISAFPRRGGTLRLRLMDGDDALAEFSIPNPCPGPHPVWKPEHMPVIVTNGVVAITLERFVCEALRLGTRCELRTRCEFRVRENGTETSAWQPGTFEIFDATGNHWRPQLDGGPSTNVNGGITVSFYGALWPEEDAWKLHMKLKAAAKETKDRAAYEVEFIAKPEQVTNNVPGPEPPKRLSEH